MTFNQLELFNIDGHVWTDGESVFFRFNNSGFIDGGGVAYVPDGRVLDTDRVSTSRKLSDPWQSIFLPF